MSKHFEHRVTIVMHGDGSAMSLEYGGRIVATRTAGRGRFWMGPALRGDIGPLSVALCQESFPVLHRHAKLRPAP
jgi:hypothetical protein